VAEKIEHAVPPRSDLLLKLLIAQLRKGFVKAVNDKPPSVENCNAENFFVRHSGMISFLV